MIAMSGGVDSSVAAYLMLQQGFECIGATMKLYDNPDIGLDEHHTCCSLSDVQDAKAVANHLGMDHFVYNFRERFEAWVINRFIDSYKRGETPNPCIDCNRYLKFSGLFRRARELDCGYVVTGHYARVKRDEVSGRYLLQKAVDATKDQSYVLYTLTQAQLAHLLLPLGGYTKTEIREMAQSEGFVNARKHDSQDICFVPGGDYAHFIEEKTGPSKPGHFVDPVGHILGEHKGIIHYTIGQRRGLGIAFGTRMYVVDIDAEKNQVVVGNNDDLRSAVVYADRLNLISISEITGPLRCKARLRYSMKEQPCTVTPLTEPIMESGSDSKASESPINPALKICVEFDEPQRAPTKGQALVLYDGDNVQGGGTICGYE